MGIVYIMYLVFIILSSITLAVLGLAAQQHHYMVLIETIYIN